MLVVNKKLSLNFLFALDGVSIFFFILTSLLIFLCVLFVQNEFLLKEYLCCLFSIHFILLVIFSVLDLFLFYVFFEALLVPMYLLIGFWGSRERKVRASYLLFFYTACGSILLIVSIIYIYYAAGTFNYEYLLNYNFSFKEQILLWLAFFISFASKVPMFPFHIWLPEAHVEAPTVGSVLLAGILLKLGVYGLIRYNLTFFPLASHFFVPLVYTLSIISIIAASLDAIRQTDLKRIVAYSSIAHMNIVILGVFSFNTIGLSGAIFQSISHGFVSGALFFLIGIIYNKYHTRYIAYYSGLTQLMPLYSIFFLLFTLANIALPGTSSFVGEFIILLGLYKSNKICSFISTSSVIISGIYSLWVYNRIVFGNLKSQFTLKYTDISLTEFFILSALGLLVLVLGLFPRVVLDFVFSGCASMSILYQ
jgi:NADH-quinone oxidoreductase subunit M